MTTSKVVHDRSVNDGGIYMIESFTCRGINLTEPSEQFQNSEQFQVTYTLSWE